MSELDIISVRNTSVQDVKTFVYSFKMFVAAAFIAVQSGTGLTVMLPQKPNLVAQTEYDHLSKVTRYAEAGKTAMALGGLYALSLKEGVLITELESTLSEDRRTAISRSISNWNNWLGRPLFGVSSSEPSAKLTIRVVDKFPTGGKAEVMGKISIDRKFGTVKGEPYFAVDATIWILNRYEGTRLNDAEFEEILSHEIGHLVGLRDHEATDGLMGKFVYGRPRTKISQDELSAVRTYRNTLQETIEKTIAGQNSKSEAGPKKIDLFTHVGCHCD